MKEVPDHLEKGLAVVFIGFNPSPISAENTRRTYTKELR